MYKEFDLDLEAYLIKTATNILDDNFSQYDNEQVSIALREILSTMDQHWKDHLLSMDHMKEGIN